MTAVNTGAAREPQCPPFRTGDEEFWIVNEEWYETMFLLWSRVNSARLVSAIAEADAGGGTVRELVGPGAAADACVFVREGWEDYTYWVETDRQQARRINLLIDACNRDPFRGLGEPEPLKGELLSGWWSRRIDAEHRLVYRLNDGAVEIIQARTYQDD